MMKLEYDVSISNLKLEKTEKSEEQIEKERVEALLTGDETLPKERQHFQILCRKQATSQKKLLTEI